MDLGLAHAPGVRLVQVGDEEGGEVQLGHPHHGLYLQLAASKETMKFCNYFLTNILLWQYLLICAVYEMPPLPTPPPFHGVVVRICM